jgi:hypothetical protein
LSIGLIVASHFWKSRIAEALTQVKGSKRNAALFENHRKNQSEASPGMFLALNERGQTTIA